MAGIVERIQEFIKRLQATRLGRMNARYGAAKGAQLAGGIAYAALFSVFAVLTIAFTIFMRVIGNNEAMLQAVLDAVDEALPGIVDNGSNGGQIKPEDLILDSGLTWTTVIASVTLLLSALAVMGALSGSVRAMFGLVAAPGNPIIMKLRDLSGFVVLASSVVVTAALGIGAGAAGSWVTSLIGLESSVTALLVRTLGLLGAFGVDLLVFVALIRVVGGARPPRRDLWIGAAIGAVGSGAIRLLGTTLVGGATANPLLASFAALVTLLLWVNLVARLALYIAAWIANPPSPVVENVKADDLHVKETPNYVTLSAPHTLTWDFDQRTGAVLFSEAEREVREAADAERAEREAQLTAALEAASTQGGWLEQRLARRRARKAVREARSTQEP